MFAVIKAGAHQYKVSKGESVTIDLIKGNVGDAVTLDQVMMVGGEKTLVGTPLVAGAKVQGVIKNQGFGDKITVFHYKRRKNYKVTRGHKQPLTTIEITDIQV